jgi:glycosyltransferase involved in cell wall biosynthesis
MLNFPERIAVIVPVYHDTARGKVAGTDRIDLLKRCLASVVQATHHCQTNNTGFREITIVAIDDYSPSDPEAFLDADLLRQIRWLKNAGVRGQGGALNFAMATINADAFAFTDSDCVVARDWLQRIAEHYRAYPYHGGVGGPHWLFGVAAARWPCLLTSQEAALMRFLAESKIDHVHATTTRVDCRNLSLRADFAARLTAASSLFRSDGSVSVSGQASHFLKRQLARGEAPVGFSLTMRTLHQPVSSIMGQIARYYARGRWSAFDEIYFSQYENLRAALTRRYALRDFISPVLSASASVWYVWPVHLAFWVGIARRRWVAQRIKQSLSLDVHES